MLKVFCNNLVNILPVYIGIPDRLGVHSDYRAFCTAIQATGSINAHPALSRQPQRLAALLGVITQPLCVKALAAISAVSPQIGAEKDMVLVEGHIL